MDKQKIIFIIFVLLLACALGAGVFLRLFNPEAKNRTPDERVYTYHASTISTQGLSATKALVAQNHADKKMWIYPPPIRIGYIYLCAGLMKLLNSTDEKTLVHISLFFSVLSLALLAFMALRFLNRWAALCSIVFMAVSPVELAIARRVWQDGVVGFFSLALVYFCCEISLNHKRKIWYALFFIFGIYSMLIKDRSSITIFGLLVIWILVVAWFNQKSLKAVFLLAALSMASVVMSILIIGLATGDARDFFKILIHMSGAVQNNTYAVTYQNGPWYYFITGFWLLSPVCTVFGLIGIITAFLQRQNEKLYFGLVFFIVAFVIILTAPAHFKNLRYISCVYGPFYLLGGLGAWHMASFLKLKFSRTYFYIAVAIIALAIVAGAARDYIHFYDLFINRQVPDLVNIMFVEFG
ncbi:MAG: glycosyltransferase family 39 protein [Candidatus Omnitrophota bacterium]